MTFKEFEKFQEDILQEVIDMGQTKGKEYAYEGKDRFQNFNEDAADNDLPRLICAMIHFSKHLRAIKGFIRNRRTFSDEPIRGRLVDAINYLTLIAGMIWEDNLFSPNLPMQDDYPKFESDSLLPLQHIPSRIDSIVIKDCKFSGPYESNPGNVDTNMYPPEIMIQGNKFEGI